MLHNFGGDSWLLMLFDVVCVVGERALYGNMKVISTAPIDAKQYPGSTMAGIGLTMEV